jgi:hypothetical protein
MNLRRAAGPRSPQFRAGANLSSAALLRRAHDADRQAARFEAATEGKPMSPPSSSSERLVVTSSLVPTYRLWQPVVASGRVVPAPRSPGQTALVAIGTPRR